MAGQRRARPAESRFFSTSRRTPDENRHTNIDSDNDRVEKFVSDRHHAMNRELRAGDSESEEDNLLQHVNQRTVLDIGESDSDSDSAGDHSEHLQQESDEEKEHGNENEMIAWGSNRKNWYGGDTHQYEIMEDEERKEALREEEEEAIRLQNKALSQLLPEDYRDHDADESDDDQDDLQTALYGTHSSAPYENDKGGDMLDSSGAQLKTLYKELNVCQHRIAELEARNTMDERARIMHNLNVLFVANVSFYFALRTDPESIGIDIRTHPVLSRIVQLRSLLQKAKSLPEQMSEQNLEAPAHLEEKESQEEPNVYESTKSDEERDHAKASNPKKKKKKRKKVTKKPRQVEIEPALEADERKVASLLEIAHTKELGEDEDILREQKRRKLNKITGTIERERKNEDAKRLAPPDLDLVREEPSTTNRSQQRSIHTGEGMAALDGRDDDAVMEKMLAKQEKKAVRKARKDAETAPHVYRFKDDVDPSEKRRASSQIVKNRGLTRYRPRDKKTPRTKNRLSYSKAVVRRKGAVRDYAGKHGGSYGGEASGINMSVRKGSKFS